MSDAYEAWLQDTPVRTIVFAQSKVDAINQAYEQFNFYCPDITRQDVMVKRAGQYDVYINRGKLTMRHLIYQLGWTWFCDCCSSYVNRNNVGLVWDEEDVAYCSECSKLLNRDVIS